MAFVESSGHVTEPMMLCDAERSRPEYALGSNISKTAGDVI